ncbi:MAG: hypothetical protein EOP65_02350 [Sphingomonas sp.]|jgi:hypothetical protein|uniref:hypothetical protein n=1 Tax=Sphingomonas sp. CD22 TaxID=3100214 RepID=UPI00120F00BD|nr:hypothetical protein [Sphingomonas sp. CD22]MEA1084143.1 hypothetical protein [Sphingomonas sp. CD22]RZL59704.1 MAG: hypothetical protein EOP65_02350 [Sphingomonas sp.]
MTAAYRFKGIGWFGGCVAIVLGFYLVSLQVAAERKKLETMDRKIDSAQRDIRALETEFETRANLAQLEKWNGETLALAAPVAGQFVTDEGALASLDVNQVGVTAPGTKMAALVVPSLATVNVAAPAATPAPAVVQVAAALPTAKRAVIKVAAIEKSAPMLAKLNEAARAKVAVAKVRPQAVAMLDKKLLSDTTLGDILSSARAEARKR